MQWQRLKKYVTCLVKKQKKEKGDCVLNQKPVDVEATAKGHRVTLRIQSHSDDITYKLDLCNLTKGEIVLETDSIDDSDDLAQTFKQISHILERDVSETRLIQELDKRYVLKSSEENE
jgi:hypothetical protein